MVLLFPIPKGGLRICQQKLCGIKKVKIIWENRFKLNWTRDDSYR